MDKSVGFVDFNKITSNTDAFLLSEYFVEYLHFNHDESFQNINNNIPTYNDENLLNKNNDQKSSLLKINPFNKNVKTKIKLFNHDNDEYKIKRKIIHTSNLMNDRQKILLDKVNNNNYFILNERNFENHSKNPISEFDYNKKQIFEVKQPENFSQKVDDLKKDLNKSIEKINNDQEKKIEEVNKFIMKKFNEFEKETNEKIKENSKIDQEKLMKTINDNNVKKLEEFKRNFLRS